MMNKILRNIIDVNTNFEGIVLDYLVNMSSECDSINEIVENQEDFMSGNTDLVYTYKCKPIFRDNFEEILEIMESYRIMCCDSHPYYEYDEMIRISFDYKMYEMIRELEYHLDEVREEFNEYYGFDEDEEDMTKYIVFNPNK